MKNDAALLDKLKEGFGYLTDVELAGFLGITKDSVSVIRRGENGLSNAQRIKVMDRLESIRVRDLVMRMAPENLAVRIKELSQNGASKLALNSLEKGEANPTDIELIDLFKTHFGYKSDQLLADFLGVKRNTISMVRSGKSRLGPLPRLRMLKQIDVEDVTDIERGIESSEYLINLIDEHIKMKKEPN